MAVMNMNRLFKLIGLQAAVDSAASALEVAVFSPEDDALQDVHTRVMAELAQLKRLAEQRLAEVDNTQRTVLR